VNSYFLAENQFTEVSDDFSLSKYCCNALPADKNILITFLDNCCAE